jgi:hypothetical protein
LLEQGRHRPQHQHPSALASDASVDCTYKAPTEDNSSCTFADRQWRATSAVTGKTDAGTYRLIDDRQVEIEGLGGNTVWQRQ